MRSKLLFLVIAASLFLSCGKPAPSADKPQDIKPAEPTKEKQSITMATTTSTYDSGLLDYLNPKFTEKAGIEVRVVSMGSGAAIGAGEEGNADLILIHDPEGERRFVADGFGVNERNVMYNDFVILGPPNNPAGLAETDDTIKAFAKIAGKKAIFISRGDDSGTHRREQQIWRDTGLPLEENSQVLLRAGEPVTYTIVNPPGEWYVSIGQGMGQALNMANEKRAYVLADRGTYLAYKGKLDLRILNQGDAALRNQYSIIAVSPERHPKINFDSAMKYIDWITSPEGQKLIGDFTIDGEQLFHPNYTEEVSTG